MVEDDNDYEEDSKDPCEQDVLVHLKLSNRAMGTAMERLELQQLADQLETAVLEAKVGEYDGDEYGGGECILFFAGPDADKLFAVLQPMLRASPLSRGATVQIQSGEDAEPIHKRV